MNVTIIIIGYNSGDLIDKCLESVIEMTTGIDYEIIFVDNASQDNSANMVQSKYNDVSVLKNDSNLGFAAAVNKALKFSHSEFVFLLNPDALLLNNAVKIFADFFAKNVSGNIACAGGAVFTEDFEPAISYGHFPSLKQIFFEEFGLRKLFPDFYFRHLSPGCIYVENKNKKVDYICGANFFFRRDLIDKIGYFDEDFFLYYEETEFCYRAVKNNFLNILIPEARILHFGGKSMEKSGLDEYCIKKKSEFIFFKKCNGKAAAFLAKIFYVLGSVLKLILKLDSKQFTKIKILLKS